MIMLIFIPFFLGFISYLTPTGPITVMIFKNTLLGKYGRAISIIIGSTFVQFFISFASIILITEIISKKWILYSKIISSVVFIILGIHLILSKGKASEQIISFQDISKKEKAGSISTGILLTFLNPTIIFSWLTAITLFVSFNFLKITSNADYFVFSTSGCLGIVIGSLLMMYLVHIYKKQISEKRINQILSIFGIFLILIGIYFSVMAFVI